MEAKVIDTKSHNDSYDFLKEGFSWPALEYPMEAYEFHERSKPFVQQVSSAGSMTPEFLVQILKVHFKYYREMRLTSESKAIQEAELTTEARQYRELPQGDDVAISQDGYDHLLDGDKKPEETQTNALATLSYFANRVRSAAGQATTFVRSTVGSLNAMRTPKHTALTLWFETQMQAILEQQASPRKKMTDLTILLAGLVVHLGENRHSTTLFPLCRDVYALVWTPGYGSFIKPLPSTRSDKQHFEERFRYQILAAARIASVQFIFRGGPFYGATQSEQAEYSKHFQHYMRSRSVEIATYSWLNHCNLPTPIDYPEANMGLQYNSYLDSLPVDRPPPVVNLSDDTLFNEAPDPRGGSHFLDLFK